LCIGAVVKAMQINKFSLPAWCQLVMSSGGPSACCRLLIITMVSAAKRLKLLDPESSYKFMVAGAVM